MDQERKIKSTSILLLLAPVLVVLFTIYAITLLIRDKNAEAVITIKNTLGQLPPEIKRAVISSTTADMPNVQCQIATTNNTKKAIPHEFDDQTTDEKNNKSNT